MKRNRKLCPNGIFFPAEYDRFTSFCAYLESFFFFNGILKKCLSAWVYTHLMEHAGEKTEFLFLGCLWKLSFYITLTPWGWQVDMCTRTAMLSGVWQNLLNVKTLQRHGLWCHWKWQWCLTIYDINIILIYNDIIIFSNNWHARTTYLVHISWIFLHIFSPTFLFSIWQQCFQSLLRLTTK